MSVYTQTLYQNHGSAIGYWKGSVDLNGYVTIEYAKKLDGKPVQKHYQAFAKNVGRANATTPYEQGASEVASKARLKMDKGYVETVEEATEPSTNILGLLKPMLATPLEKIKPEKIDWSYAFVQPKLDGHRALFNDGVLYSRQGKVLDLPHITKAITAAGIDHLHLDGELYIHGKTLQEMSKLIKKRRPETLAVKYHIYDHITDAPFIERIQTLVQRFSSCINTTTVPVETIKISNMESLMALHGDYRKKGYEGTMLRFGSDNYQHGKRSRTLLKLKEFQDAEFEIIAVDEGKPYITDEGTFRVPIYTCVVPENGETFTVTAPGNMHAKHALWVDSDVTRGRYLTVKFHYYSADGIPQLPIALRFYETV
jgi:DNA ligase-1